MKEAEVYQLIWKRYFPVITMKLKQVVRNGGSATIGMYKFEFQSEGNKKKAGFQFNLELREGRIISDIAKSIAAKELAEMMRQDPNIRPLLNAGHFSFVLDTEYVLTIEKKA